MKIYGRDWQMKIYKSKSAEHKIVETYDKLLALWGVPVQEKDVDTFYGATHVIQCGLYSNPPLVLFHGVGDDSALMWLYNAQELAKHFCIYAVDTIGGPGKSRPNANYTKAFDEIRWLDEVLQGLGLGKVFLAGVSNGAYITQHYGIMRPDKAMKMICMSGSAVSTESGKSTLMRMLKVFLPEALFPTDRNVARLIKKLAGDNYKTFTENTLLMEHYQSLLRGFNTMAMTYHRIMPFTREQIDSLKGRTLFLCGEKDPLGDRNTVQALMEKHGLQFRFFPNVGHGINHEIPHEINHIMIDFLQSNGTAH
jgi:pimeloyl-ACP methyl ester carboxylesterase